MPFCQSCGNQLASDAKLCQECGAIITSGQKAEAPLTEGKPASAPAAVMATGAEPVLQQQYQIQVPPPQIRQISPEASPVYEEPASIKVYQSEITQPIYPSPEQPNNTQDTQPEALPKQPAPDDAEPPRKGMAALSYLSILVLIPLFAARKSRFMRFHINQGLGAFICIAVVNIISYSTAGFVYGLERPLALVISGLLSLIFIFAIILGAVGFFGAFLGKTTPLPLIGRIRLLK